ncbi:photosystem II reaction center PsbP [Gloeocapsopsis dulcis]|uniref:Photosystem II oxygen evolving complex protein PsbP n=1 Tax=Gloeocapsopsis dulcis AAB1 = 1H9 TaxID=1433147 RepID=A0A6N8FR41_9CHRO|nr:photosystem II reaction center PsbP [Gloeocapsopsis dulcis]MUL35603.1 photosystem II oxygen evolving complex protein PsbP [Gloeocapsopsis dulcis AAB1 = 1H9]WNN87495.1 photosystem II reaction center PsbP [Gloeocapsopsis dulcis]
MLRRTLVILLIAISVTLTSCTSAVSGLKSYVDSTDGYEFLYPNGWVPVNVSNGPDVVLHDLIETTENVSVVISDVPQGKTLADLGNPSEVGYKLGKSAIAPVDSGREAELVNAAKLETDTKTYYLLEYTVKLPNQQQRHNLASVAVSRGKLFTFNASTPERRWTKGKPTLDVVVKSFTVY